MSPKQKSIIQFCRNSENHQITTSEAVQLIGGHYYANERKHTGEVLARMVRQNLLSRISRGLYKLGSGKAAKHYVQPKEQMQLFESAVTGEQ